MKFVSVRFATASYWSEFCRLRGGEETTPDKDNEKEVKPTVAAAPADPLGETVEKAIQVTSQRRLTAGVHTPWQVVHGILAQRWDLTLARTTRRRESAPSNGSPAASTSTASRSGKRLPTADAAIPSPAPTPSKGTRPSSWVT